MSSHISKIIEECSYKESLRVFCGTFNANGKYPDEDLKAWLFVNDEPVDVYAIGFQEVVDLNTQSFLLQTDWIERETAWVNAINNEFLNRENKISYILREKIRMFGLLLLVYVKESWHNSIYDVFKAEVATGIMDALGNKGSVGVSIRIHETRICFICSHFAADTEKISKRNSDFRSTTQRLRFEYNANLDYYDLEVHDIIFWFGDLNYRIDSISLVKAINLINSNELDELIKNDQLTNEKMNLKVFQNYNEGKINFRPTYKYLVRQDTYAKQESLKNSPTPNELACDRIAYTDRVLWRTLENNLKVNLKQYSCINTITISDHKPVYALFDVEVKVIDNVKYNKKYDDWLKDADKRQNDEMPHIFASAHEYKFENCLFYDQKSFYFKVKNKGLRLTNVGIRFYEPSSTDSFDSRNSQVARSIINKPSQWVEINPQLKERVGPGSDYKVELKTNLNYNNLKRLNKSPEIHDFLIISCLNGNDLFFTISIKYQRTIIGYSLKGLSTLKKEESFIDSDVNLLSDNIETDIEKFEEDLNNIWLNGLKKISIENEELKLKAVMRHENIQQNINRLDIYKKNLLALKKQIVDQDKYFNNDLSSEYAFLMRYLIDKCTKNVSTSDSIEKTNIRDSTFTALEDQKNKILILLSSKYFEQFENEAFELEILVEVLKDLLCSLPVSLIPNRYIDYLMYADNSYEDATFLFDYIPKPNLELFKMIVDFLMVSPECFNYSYIIANALFKINLNMTNYETDINDNASDVDSYKRKTADKFLNIFIKNHK